MRDPTQEEIERFEELQATIIFYHCVGIVGVIGTLINATMFASSPGVVFLFCGMACMWITYHLANKTAEHQVERDKLLESLKD